MVLALWKCMVRAQTVTHSTWTLELLLAQQLCMLLPYTLLQAHRAAAQQRALPEVPKATASSATADNTAAVDDLLNQLHRPIRPSGSSSGSSFTKRSLFHQDDGGESMSSGGHRGQSHLRLGTATASDALLRIYPFGLSEEKMREVMSAMALHDKACVTMYFVRASVFLHPITNACLILCTSLSCQRPSNSLAAHVGPTTQAAYLRNAYLLTTLLASLHHISMAFQLPWCFRTSAHL